MDYTIWMDYIWRLGRRKWHNKQWKERKRFKENIKKNGEKKSVQRRILGEKEGV